MKRLNSISWMVLGSSSVLIGTYVLLVEGAVHSRFYVYYIFALFCAILLFRKRKVARKNTKPKKRQ